MKSRLGQLADLSWQSVAYGIGVFGRQVVVYLVLPFFTNGMAQSEYGVVVIGIAVLTFANRLSNAGLPAATFRFYNEYDDPAERRATLGNAQAMVAAYALTLALGMVVAAGPLSKLLFGDAGRAHLLMILAGLLLLETVVSYGAILLRLRVRPLATSLQSLVHVSLQLGLALFFVGRGMGAEGYWIGHLVGGVGGAALMLGLVRRDLVFRVGRARMLEMVRYALPLLPGTLALWALRLVDRIFVANLAGLEQAAIYEIGYKVGSLVTLFVGPFFTAWPQFSFSIMKLPEAKRTYRDVATFVMAGTTMLALAVIALRQPVVDLLAPADYANASSVVPWVALAQVPWALYPVFAIGLKIAKRTGFMAGASVVAAVVNVGLNLWLIPRFGIVGAAVATIASFIVLAFGSYLVGSRFYHFGLDWRRVFILLAAVAVTLVGILGAEAWARERGLGFGPGVAALALYPAVLAGLGFVRARELRAAWRRAGSFIQRRRRG